MRICAAEFPDELRRYEGAIDSLAEHVSEMRPDLLVLPEMPFTPWIFHIDASDDKQLSATVENHAKWLDRLADAIPSPIITSCPVRKKDRFLNQAIYLNAERALHPLRAKCYLPNDFPALERVWFDEGDSPLGVFDILEQRVGIQICSEIMYAEIPRLLSEKGVEIIIQARATGDHPRWRAASILAASTAGAFVVGANRRSVERDWFAGGSWIYSPAGELLGESSLGQRFVTVEIDTSNTR